MLSEQEERALRSLHDFQQALKRIKQSDEIEVIREKKRQRDQEVSRNVNGTWRHSNPAD